MSENIVDRVLKGRGVKIIRDKNMLKCLECLECKEHWPLPEDYESWFAKLAKNDEFYRLTFCKNGCNYKR